MRRILVLTVPIIMALLLASGAQAGDPPTEKTDKRPPPFPGRTSQAGFEGKPASDHSGGMTREDVDRLRAPRPTPQPLRTASSTASRSQRSTGDVTGPVWLDIDKSWNGSAWDLVLTWSGATDGTTVSYSTSPSFEERVLTLEQEFVDTTLTVEESTKDPLECFDVTDSTTASRAVQGFGYDPAPTPGAPSAEGASRFAGDVWWYADLPVTTKYFDAMPKANSLGAQNRIVRADSVASVTGRFAGQATFSVPEDGRSFWIVPQANGKISRSAVFLRIRPHLLGPYTNIREITWAPHTGRFWIAADGIIQEVNIFSVIPTPGHTFTDVAKPNISRVTSDGRLLYVDGVSGWPIVYQIDTGTGARSVYANTIDAEFTRPILPVGIAASIDGNRCFIADASAGSGASKVVRVEQSNAIPIKDDYGSWPYWSFPDPAGMETTENGSVLVGASNNWVGILPDENNTWLANNTGEVPRSLHLDREASPTWGYLYWWSQYPGMHAYNRNPIDDVPGDPVRNVGAMVLSIDRQRIDVAPLWDFMPVGRHVVWPIRVILDSHGEDYDYPWRYQVADRLVEMEVQGWYNVKLHLRLIDPPDISPYVPEAGGPAQGGKTAAPPYEANDNRVWNLNPPYIDFGLTTDPTGALNPSVAWPVLEMDVTPGADGKAKFYVKVPEHYSGDNWRVEVTKKDWDGNHIPDKVTGYSAIMTGWKRAYLERERMFVGGGLLAQDASQGDQNIYLAKLQRTAPPSPWIRADNVSAGAEIAIFDADHNFNEFDHDEACVKSIAPEGAHKMKVELAQKSDCTTPYQLKYDYSSGVDQVSHLWTFPDGTSGAGVGRIDFCSTAANKINTSDSCLYTADLGGVEQAFSDAYVEFHAPRWEMGEVPYIPREFFDDSANTFRMVGFEQTWFGNFNPQAGDPLKPEPHNYFHVIGASEHTDYGFAAEAYDFAFLFVDAHNGQNPQETTNMIRDTAAHELAHLFAVNPEDCGGHDALNAWCNGVSPCMPEYCLMNLLNDGKDDTFRLCEDDLLNGVATPGSQTCDSVLHTWTAGQGAIRTETDPH